MKKMMRKQMLLLLALSLLLGVASAENTVEFVDGREAYTTLYANGMVLHYDAEYDRYVTSSGLVWMTELQKFGQFEPLLMPESEDGLRKLNGLYAAMADASGFWSEQVSGQGMLPVYTAPDETSYRAGDGKAAVALQGGVKLLMTYGDWNLICYEVNSSRSRFGWVRTNELGAAPVMLTDMAVTLTAGGFLTDDPLTSWYHLAEGSELMDVHLLAQYNAYWGYVSAKKADGQAIWGFVPLRYMERTESVDEQMMARLSGTWGFTGGGEMMGDVFTLTKEGQSMLIRLSEEAEESQRYLTEGLTAEMNPEIKNTGTWRIVDGTNGHARDLVVEAGNGVISRYHIDATSDEENVLTLTQGEGGGSYVRLPS